MRRRRRPLATAAMIGGTAYVANQAGKKSAQAAAQDQAQDQAIADLQAQQAAPAQPQYAPPPPQYAAPPPQYAAPAPAPAAEPAGLSMDDKVEQLTKLKGLLDAGVLTQPEFDAQKAKILGE